MRAAELERDEGASVTYIPGSTSMTQRRDQRNQEAQSFRVMNVLFADDTKEPQMENTKNAKKKIMSFFEEKTNDAKEENIILCGKHAAETHLVGTWLGEAIYTNQEERSLDKGEAETKALPTDEENASASRRTGCGEHDDFQMQCPDLDNRESEPLAKKWTTVTDTCGVENATTTDGTGSEEKYVEFTKKKLRIKSIRAKREQKFGTS